MTIAALSVVFLVQAGVSGCASVGSGRFSCAGRPQGVRCAGVRDVYDLTQNTDRVSATAARPLGDNPERTERARREQEQRDQEAGVASAPTTPTTPAGPAAGGGAGAGDGSVQASAAGRPQVDRPTPVRTPAQVMRVWIAPWEDNRGVLHVGGYHFMEVIARRWTLAGPVSTEPARVFSINEPIAESPEDAGASAVAGLEAGLPAGQAEN